jgi:protocatechuate 3,4-dioxygenase beta subunit
MNKPVMNAFTLGLVLSSAIEVSMAAESCVPTEGDALGPFYVSETAVVADLNRGGRTGEVLTVTGRILSAGRDHAPLSNVRVEVWQTDGDGRYYPQGSGKVGDYADSEVDLRGAVVSDEMGRYRFRTVVPGGYRPRPRHFHYRITAPGHKTLVTQLYITGDGVLRQPGGECRHAAVEQTADGQRYSAPDIYIEPN